MKKITGVMGGMLLIATQGAYADGMADGINNISQPKMYNTVYLNDHQKEDQILTDAVLSALSHDPKLEGDYITVSSHNGIVTLSGKVRNVSMLYRAIETAQKVNGVKQVNEDLNT